MNPFDAEAAVLGGCMLEAAAYWRVADLLVADDFAGPRAGEVWAALADMARRGMCVDAVTFGEVYPALATIALDMAAATPGTANIRAYAEIVRRCAVTRRVRAAGPRIATLGGQDALGDALRILAACAPGVASAIKPAKDYLSQSIALMAQRCEATEVLTGVPTSLAWLDETTAGWQRGDLVVIAARPSVGKTALAVQAALHGAQHGHAVLFLSLEMAGHQLTDRMLAHLAGVDMQAIRQPKRLREEEWVRVGRAGEAIATLPLWIDDSSLLDVAGIGARVRQADAAHRLGMVVIDYLTQIKPPKAQSTNDAVQEITRALKALAKDVSVPVVLLSQLNRDGDRAPSLVSLRDSGAIEQDADVVLLLHRPDPENLALVTCHVAKQRNGPTGECYLHLDGARQIFSQTNERPPDRPTTRGMRLVGVAA